MSQFSLDNFKNIQFLFAVLVVVKKLILSFLYESCSIGRCLFNILMLNIFNRMKLLKLNLECKKTLFRTPGIKVNKLMLLFNI